MKRILLFALFHIISCCPDFLVLDAMKEGWVIDENSKTICSIQQKVACYQLYFKPTEKFQYIRAGQRIPKGLHVTIDFKTGVKMAKLMVNNRDNGGDNEKSLLLVPEEIENSAIIHTQDELEENKRKQSHVTVEENETLSELFKELQSNDSISILNSLDMLGDAGHYFDVGIAISRSRKYIRILVDLLEEGFEGYKRFPHAKDPIRCASAKVLGSLVQNNQVAAKHIIGHSPSFLKSIFDAFSLEISVEKERHCVVCAKRIFFVISAITRANEDAFMIFVSLKPFETLLKAAKEFKSLSPKIINWFNDTFKQIANLREILPDLDLDAYCQVMGPEALGSVSLLQESAKLFVENSKAFSNLCKKYSEKSTEQEL